MKENKENEKIVNKTFGDKILEYIPTVLVTLPAFGIVMASVFEFMFRFIDQPSDSNIKLLYLLFTCCYFLSPFLYLFLILIFKSNNIFSVYNKSKINFEKKLLPFYFLLIWLVSLTMLTMLLPELFYPSKFHYTLYFLLFCPPFAIWVFDIILNKSKNLINKNLTNKNLINKNLIKKNLINKNLIKKNLIKKNLIKKSIFYFFIIISIGLGFISDQKEIKKIISTNNHFLFSKDSIISPDTNAFLIQNTLSSINNDIQKLQDKKNSFDTYNNINSILAKKKNIDSILAKEKNIVDTSLTVYFNRLKMEFNDSTNKTKQFTQFEQVKLQFLKQLKTAFTVLAKKALLPIYNKTQKHGLFILITLILIILAYRKSGLELFINTITSEFDDKKTFWEAIRTNVLKVSKPAEKCVVICILLIIPLVQPIQEKDLKVEDPVSSIKLHTWNLKSSLYNWYFNNNESKYKDLDLILTKIQKVETITDSNLKINTKLSNDFETNKKDLGTKVNLIETNTDRSLKINSIFLSNFIDYIDSLGHDEPTSFYKAKDILKKSGIKPNEN